jgi:futalosine hydrolase
MAAGPLPAVLIVAAVDAELRPVERLLAEAPRRFAPRLAVTGVGKASAAMETAIALREGSPACVLQVGCAGAFPGRGLSPGDVVIADAEVFSDEGVEGPQGFLDLAALGLLASSGPAGRIGNDVPVTRPRAETLEEVTAHARGRFAIRVGRLATVSTGSGTRRRAEEVAARREPLAESMEGAAAALAAWRHGVPFYEVRGISNLAGERDRAAWDIETACERAAEVAVRIIDLEIGGAAGGGSGRG